MKKQPSNVEKILDLKDRKLILEMFSRERLFKTVLSRRLGISQELLSYRLKRLQREEIILKTIPVIDYSALGYTIYRLQIAFNTISAAQREEFTAYIRKIPEISWLVELSGSWDIVLGFLIRQASEFESIYDQIITNYGSMIKDKLFTIVTSIEHISPNYIYNKQDEILVTGRSTKSYTLEENAIKILRELLTDGSLTLTELSKRLGVSITTIKYHLQFLESKGIIVGYRPIVNIHKIIYEHFKIVIELVNPQDKKILKEMLRRNKNTVYITESLGKYDIEFEAEYEKINDLFTFIEEIKKTINIKNYEIIFSNKEIVINEVV